MTLLQYAGFLSITLGGILLVMRMCFFLLNRQDPIKAVVPDLGKFINSKGKQKEVITAISGNS